MFRYSFMQTYGHGLHLKVGSTLSKKMTRRSHWRDSRMTKHRHRKAIKIYSDYTKIPVNFSNEIRKKILLILWQSFNYVAPQITLQEKRALQMRLFYYKIPTGYMFSVASYFSVNSPWWISNGWAGGDYLRPKPEFKPPKATIGKMSAPHVAGTSFPNRKADILQVGAKTVHAKSTIMKSVESKAAVSSSEFTAWPPFWSSVSILLTREISFAKDLQHHFRHHL